MESISLVLKQTDEFRPVCIPSSEPDVITETCLSELPEIIFMDVVPALPETGIEARLGVIRRLREKIPGCKSVLLCDETAYPEACRRGYARQTEPQDRCVFLCVRHDRIHESIT